MTTLRETLAEHREEFGDCSCSEYVLDEPYAAHLETVVLAWVGARLAGAREGVIRGVHHQLCGCTWPGPHAGHDQAADAALTALRDALGVPA